MAVEAADAEEAKPGDGPQRNDRWSAYGSGVDVMAELRRHYRVPAKELVGMSVTLIPRGGSALAADLVDCSIGGIGLRLRGVGPSDLPMGGHVELKITSPDRGEPLVVSAVTRFRRMETGRLRCGFEFVEPLSLGETLPEPIRGLFNRRHMVRVRPEPSHPIRIRIRPGALEKTAQEAEAEMSDLSGVGTSFALQSEAAEVYESIDLLELTFSLPDTDEECRLKGRVRYRLSLAGRWRYGVEFDARETEDFEVQQSRILGYVLSLQAKMAQAG